MIPTVSLVTLVDENGAIPATVCLTTTARISASLSFFLPLSLSRSLSCLPRRPELQSTPGRATPAPPRQMLLPPPSLEERAPLQPGAWYVFIGAQRKSCCRLRKTNILHMSHHAESVCGESRTSNQVLSLRVGLKRLLPNPPVLQKL